MTILLLLSSICKRFFFFCLNSPDMSFEGFSWVPPIEGPDWGRNICVLLVDSDTTSLGILSRMLQALAYQVVTVERALDALAMTLEREGKVDLVMTELQMPDMDGLQLLDEIQKTSELPVVIMSADSNEDAILTSLKKGAVYYLVKPIAIDSMRDLWQYVFLKREKQLQKTGQKSDLPVESLGENESDQVVAGSALVSSGKNRYKEPTLTDLLQISTDQDEDSLITSARKKAKLTWTDELHYKFLFAISELGIDNAHPKKILNRMGVKGLTKDNVSSHLQKYRLAVKKDRRAIQLALALSATSPTRKYFGSNHQSLYNVSQGRIQSPTLMASQPGFATYIQNKHATPSNIIEHGQYPTLLLNQQNYSHPSMNLHGLNQTGNAGRGSNIGWGLFANPVMHSPRPWPLPPPPPQGQGPEMIFSGEAEADAWFYMRNQLFPKKLG